jgi:hypothetical protein
MRVFMGAFKNRRTLWIRRVEARCGIAPLDFKMARYIELLNISNMQDLRWSFTTPGNVRGIGAGTINKLRQIAGLPIKEKRTTWKTEAQRLYKLLEQHGIEYIKENQKESNSRAGLL